MGANPGPPAVPEVTDPVTARVLAFWESNGIVARALEGSRDGPPFRFTEGPPTANGVPHVGHLISRSLKDVVLRYRRMRGDRIVTPKAGWDCHGLPVELGIEKRLGLHSKREIEAYGVERFCAACRASALEVATVWREMSRRLGYWLDYDHAYLTMSAPYIESVWWSLKTLFDRGLLEKGFYSLPYCPRCETPLSSHEVAQGYHETTDPAVTVRFPIRRAPAEPPRSLLIWTTTPYTLPANLLVAVRADLEYSVVRAPDGSEFVVAEAARLRYFPESAPVVERMLGRELAGVPYAPPYAFAGPGENRYRVVTDESVAATEGTGLVHIAPSFGSDDKRIGEREHVGFFDPLGSHGAFTAAVPLVEGTWFKNADPILTADLKARGLLHREETIRHTYPFCWRCSTPLLYRAVDSWFVRTSRFVEQLVANNAQVTWIPAHLRDGRFGNFLEEAKDWALSRNRYWGTPLPIWTCPEGHVTCIGSFEELAERSGTSLPPGFDPHRVAVDALPFACRSCGRAARREPYTIDGWYDSGSAPFAAYHYPFEPGPVDPSVPLDYVAEGLDQTRGWFYTLLVLATALFHRPAYRVCLTNGLVLDESGEKMSKSKGNVLDPMHLLARLGGDAVRWGFFVSDYTESTHVDEGALRHAAHRTLGTLVNVLEFYRAYATPTSPAALPSPGGSISVLDRWILSRLASTAAEVTRALDAFQPRRGALALQEYVNDLSTWYLRRSRPRFWTEEATADRQAANDTLRHALGTVGRLLAPFAPFTAEVVFQTVSGAEFGDPNRSVHLASWPPPLDGIDVAIEEAMNDLRGWVEAGRELRQRAGVKSRIPLPTIVLQTKGAPKFSSMGSEGTELLRDELNVRTVRIESVETSVPAPEEGWVVRERPDGSRLALSRTPTPELVREGLLREALRRLQLARKEERLRFTERIRLTIWASPELEGLLKRELPRLRTELLAESIEFGGGPAGPPDAPHRWDLDGVELAARIDRLEAPSGGG